MIELYGTYYASNSGRLLKYCLLNKHWSKKCRCPKTKETENIRKCHKLCPKHKVHKINYFGEK